MWFFESPFTGIHHDVDVLLTILDHENFKIEKLYRERYADVLPRPKMMIYDAFSFYDPMCMYCGDNGLIRTGRSSQLSCSTQINDKYIDINFEIAAEILKQTFVSCQYSVSTKSLCHEFISRFGGLVVHHSSDMTQARVYRDDLCMVIDTLVRKCLNMFPLDDPYSRTYPSLLTEIMMKKDDSDTDEQKSEKRTPQHKWRKQVLERDKKCRCCGFTKHLEAHHIYSYRDNEQYRDDPNNGITLCRFCHKKYHSQYGRDGANPRDLLEFFQTYQVNRD